MGQGGMRLPKRPCTSIVWTGELPQRSEVVVLCSRLVEVGAQWHHELQNCRIVKIKRMPSRDTCLFSERRGLEVSGDRSDPPLSISQPRI